MVRNLLPLVGLALLTAACSSTPSENVDGNETAATINRDVPIFKPPWPIPGGYCTPAHYCRNDPYSLDTSNAFEAGLARIHCESVRKYVSAAIYASDGSQGPWKTWTKAALCWKSNDLTNLILANNTDFRQIHTNDNACDN